MVTDTKDEWPLMGLAEAVIDIIDILKGRSASGWNGPDNWKRIVRAIADNDSLSDSEIKVVEKAIREACRSWSDAQRRSIWRETDSGMTDEEDGYTLYDTSFNGIGDALQVEILDEVTRVAWQDAQELRKAVSKRPPRKKAERAETRSNGSVRLHRAEENKHAAAPFGTGTSKTPTAGSKDGNTIAEKLVARMKRKVHGKVVDIKSVNAGRAAAEELRKTVATKEELAGFHPAHAAYVYAQNQVSVMSEQLTALKEMAPFVDIVAKAEDLYMPSGPPMSPLTPSYFTCWAFFDACVGLTNETIGTTVLEVGAAFGMHTELLRLIRLMQESRMGLYIHDGAVGSLALLRELVTDAECRAIVPAGYSGKKGEIWYARVLPPPIPGSSEHIVFTTPYVVLTPGLRKWQAYFRRVLPDAPKQDHLDAYESHMKYGPTRRYWNDFVFEGYVNHRTEAIYLAGLPDVPESRPHFEAANQCFRR
jgi:hypothetical protein